MIKPELCNQRKLGPAGKLHQVTVNTHFRITQRQESRSQALMNNTPEALVELLPCAIDGRCESVGSCEG